jgi:dolichol kinase
MTNKRKGSELIYKGDDIGDYPVRVGKSLASSLAGFIAGFVVGTIGWAAIIYMLVPFCKR